MPIFKYRLFNNQSICNLTVDNQLSEMLYFNIKKIQFMIDHVGKMYPYFSTKHKICTE